MAFVFSQSPSSQIAQVESSETTCSFPSCLGIRFSNSYHSFSILVIVISNISREISSPSTGSFFRLSLYSCNQASSTISLSSKRGGVPCSSMSYSTRFSKSFSVVSTISVEIHTEYHRTGYRIPADGTSIHVLDIPRQPSTDRCTAYP